MTTAVIAPAVALGCVAAYGGCAPRLVQRVRPAVATWLLSVCSVVAAVSAALVLTLLALPMVGQDDTLADAAHWSAAVLAKDSVVGRGVAAVALTTLVALLGAAGRSGWRQRRSFVEAARVARRLGRDDGGLVVTSDEGVDAFALGGRARLVVVSRGLVRLLPAEQRRAVLAHEHAHLAHRHHLHLCAVTVAAAFNPLLWRVPATTRFLVERWADEDAARATSRSSAAVALGAVAAGAGARRRTGPSLLAAASSSVARRIAAMQAPAEPTRALALVLPAALVLAAVVAAVIATDHVWDVFRLAIAAEHRVLPRHR